VALSGLALVLMAMATAVLVIVFMLVVVVVMVLVVMVAAMLALLLPVIDDSGPRLGGDRRRWSLGGLRLRLRLVLSGRGGFLGLRGGGGRGGEVLLDEGDGPGWFATFLLVHACRELVAGRDSGERLLQVFLGGNLKEILLSVGIPEEIVVQSVLGAGAL
jgi:hypothetical protein